MATESQLLRFLNQRVQVERNDAARHQRDIPKRQRPQRVVGGVRPFTDVRVVGHDPRPRKRKGRR